MPALVHFHSGWRWVVLITIIAALISAFSGKNKSFALKGKKTALMALVFVHIQFLIGLILYSISPKVVFSSAAMKSDVLRYFLVEHISLMLLAVILITVGYSRAKRMDDDAKKFKSIRIFYSIGLILILLGIPWPWQELGAGWF